MKILKEPEITRHEKYIKIEVEVQMNLWSRQNWEIHRDLDAWIENNFEAMGLDPEVELLETEIYIDSSSIPEPNWDTILKGNDQYLNRVEVVIRLHQGED